MEDFRRLLYGGLLPELGKTRLLDGGRGIGDITDHVSTVAAGSHCCYYFSLSLLILTK